MSDSSSSPSILSTIPKQIWGIGWAVFFINASSVMVRCIAAIYLKTIVGVGTGWIGLLEGIVECMSFVIKTFSGVISDYLRRRKMFITIGYVLIAISNPILALWSSFGAVCFARVIARFGNGIQATPRDALVGDIAPEKSRGACYGLRVGLGMAGSFAGALIGLILMYKSSNNYQYVFWMATLPAVIAVLIVLVFIKDPGESKGHKDKKARNPIHWADIPRLGRKYWALMAVVAVFMVAQVGEPFMVLHAHQNFGLQQSDAPLILLIFNATYSASSFPVGVLSDRMSRYRLLAVGFVILIIADYILATATNLTTVFVGIALYGLQMGIHQSMFFTLVADTVPDNLRGTAFGIYYLISAISILFANISAGIIAQAFGESMAYLASFFIGSLALLLLLYMMPKGDKKKMNRQSR
jgi:MFS family permease